LVAGHDRMKGSAKCRLDRASGEKPSGPIKKYGDRVKIAAVERRKARLPVTRQAGAFVEVPNVTSALRAPLPHGSERREGAAPAPHAHPGPLKHA